MTITIQTYILGPIKNNTYVIIDEDTKQAALVDPAIPSKQIFTFIEQNGITLKYMLITHAHFDHIGGVKWFQGLTKDHVPVVMHPQDRDLWVDGGGAKNFGFKFDPGKVPDLFVEDQQNLKLGNCEFKVLHTPGHSHGHVTYAFIDDQIAFCGDLIFYHSVGRTDLADGNTEHLENSIRQKIFTLPDDTILYPGHGKPTSVKEEKENNPFL